MANLYNRAVSEVLEEVMDLFSDLKEEYASLNDEELLSVVVEVETKVLERIEDCRVLKD